MTLANKKNTRVHFIFSGHKSLLTRNIFLKKKQILYNLSCQLTISEKKKSIMNFLKEFIQQQQKKLL